MAILVEERLYRSQKLCITYFCNFWSMTGISSFSRLFHFRKKTLGVIYASIMHEIFKRFYHWWKIAGMNGLSGDSCSNGKNIFLSWYFCKFEHIFWQSYFVVEHLCSGNFGGPCILFFHRIYDFSLRSKMILIVVVAKRQMKAFWS